MRLRSPAKGAVQAPSIISAPAILNQFLKGITEINDAGGAFPKLDEKVRNARIALVFEKNCTK
jgi:hypothetical protein